MSAMITCPMCQSDIAFQREEATALCRDCHDMSGEELAAELQKRVNRALFLALRAVQDQAACARWASEQGRPIPPEVRESRQAAAVLDQLLGRVKRW